MNQIRGSIRLLQTFPEHCNNFGRNMPKRTMAGKGQTGKKSTSGETTSVSKGPIVQTKEGNFAISIQVKPGAKVNALTDISEEAVSVQISAPPVDGEANIAIVKYFAELLKLRKADVSLKGGKSRQKVVTIDASTGLTTDKILETLQSQKGIA